MKNKKIIRMMVIPILIVVLQSTLPHKAFASWSDPVWNGWIKSEDADINESDGDSAIIEKVETTHGGIKNIDLDASVSGSTSEAQNYDGVDGYPVLNIIIKNLEDNTENPIRKNDVITLKIHIDSDVTAGNQPWGFYNGYYDKQPIERGEGAYYQKILRPADGGNITDGGIKVDLQSFQFDDDGDDEADLTLKLTITESTAERSSSSYWRNYAWITIGNSSYEWINERMYSYIRVVINDSVQDDPIETLEEEEDQLEDQINEQYRAALDFEQYFRYSDRKNKIEQNLDSLYNQKNPDLLIKFLESTIFATTHYSITQSNNPDLTGRDIWKEFFFNKTTIARRIQWRDFLEQTIKSSSDKGWYALQTLKKQIEWDGTGSPKGLLYSDIMAIPGAYAEAQAVHDAFFQTANELEDEKEKIRYRLDILRDEGSNRGATPFYDIFEDIGHYIPEEKEEDIKVTNRANKILSVVTSIGMIVAVLMVAIIGIKYMISSVEDKAEYKKDMIPYFVGAILLFGITAIVKALQLFGQSINNL